MYNIIGFHIVNEIAFPEKMKAFKITNPDAPIINSYVNLTVNGEKVECAMILYSKENYKEGPFFKYLNVGFLRLTGSTVKSIFLNNEEPEIYAHEEVSGFYEQVGNNTKYVINPEEILADNFAFALLQKQDLPNTEILKEIIKKFNNEVILKKNK